ncbi:KH domain-containing protein [Haloglomus salinum]|jgi:ribosomal RNA assembly protein|uniref:KH domain-containing protein n=1 Tax=Haloglomus salinum TaxID=2962673 RepID=UPI0020C99888|nr:KH domain-containing protein [Haloglomus salinum]
MQHVTIPQDRVGALIGEGGETMREIESRAEVRLDIDSETGSVRVETVGDPVKGLKGPDIVKAIGRGFSPEAALSLLGGDMRMLDLVDLRAATRNENDLRRQKGRLIGEDGRTRQLMAELSGAEVVIYGKTVGIIGEPEEVEVVRSAVEMILDGAPHGAVYSFLERKHNEMETKGIEYHEFPGGEAGGAEATGDPGEAEGGD